MKIGPLEMGKSTGNAYLAFGPSGLDVVIEANDTKGLAALARRGGGEVLICEPALGKAARTRGLQVARPGTPALSAKAALAVGLAHGPALAKLPPELALELIEATIAFDAAKPWFAFDADEEVRIRFEPDGGEVAGCVLGQGGQELGLALYDEPGTVAKVITLLEAGRYEAARKFPCVTLLLDRDPSFARAAVEELTGVALAPLLLRVVRGKSASVSGQEAARMIASLRAIVALARGDVAASGESSEGEGTVTAHAARPSADASTSGDHLRDGQLVEEVLRYGAQRFGGDVLRRALEQTFGCRPLSHQLVDPIVAYAMPFDGMPLAAHFLAATPRLGPRDREWIERQLATRLSIWEVLRVEPGTGLEVVDLLSGHRCFVTENKGSQTLRPRLLVLGRVLTGALNLFCGMHESPLAPVAGEELVRNAPASGDAWSVASALITKWNDALDAADRKAKTPTKITNTDGDDVAEVEDQFTVARDRYGDVVRVLAGLEGASVDGSRAKSANLTFTRPGNRMHHGWANTVVGTARVTPTRLTLHTNSLQRAEALVRWLRTELGDIATWKKRTASAMPVMYGGQTLSIDSQATNTADARGFVRSWLDAPIRVLANRTPREAALDPASRDAVHWLLKDLEYQHELHRMTDVDPHQLRRELGLDEVGQPLANLELHRALGSGRTLTDTILEFARPLLDAAPAQNQRGLKDTLEVARDAWNAVVADQLEPSVSHLASLRAQLQHHHAQYLLKWTDVLAARKLEHFAHDRRTVGAIHVRRVRADFLIDIDVRIDATLEAKLKEAGLLPLQPATRN